jgi:tripartite-type tricarboxylate transporter receptor subunit TctC
VTPGSGSDFTSRVVSQGISVSLGQPVIVDNRGFGGISKEIVATAVPDGYTLLTSGPTLWILPLLQGAAYDIFSDFSPITLTDKSPNILVVHPSVPAKSLRELIAFARSKPGQLNIATGQSGSANHLAEELFKSEAGVNIVRIPYKGSALSVNAIISGEVQLLFTNDVSVMEHVKAGRLRALAVTSAQPSQLAPGLPTVAESGLPGFEAVSITGIFAPARTPMNIISRLNTEIVRVLRKPEVREQFLRAGLETVGSTPEEFSTELKSEVMTWGKVIKNAGIKAD